MSFRLLVLGSNSPSPCLGPGDGFNIPGVFFGRFCFVTAAARSVPGSAEEPGN